MISFRPGIESLRKALRLPTPDLQDAATERWTIAAGDVQQVAPAICLPGQIERTRGVEFGPFDMVMHHLRGNYDVPHDPVIGFRVRDLHVIDGVCFAGRAARHLRVRRRHVPAVSIESEHASGTFYESWNGGRWFGPWLNSDCLTYPLAAGHGEPVACGPRHAGLHAADYEQRYGMVPRRVGRAHFDEAVFFHDSDSAHRRDRAHALRRRLVPDDRAFPSHPGVFLLRGTGGAKRVLTNERELAARLEKERGFRIMDPSNASLDEIIAACAGARVVAGVEGSQMAHALAIMPLDACFLALFPASRVVSVFKLTTDLQGQSFALVVGPGDIDGFTIPWEEIDATLDLPGVYR